MPDADVILWLNRYALLQLLVRFLVQLNSTLQSAQVLHGNEISMSRAMVRLHASSNKTANRIGSGINIYYKKRIIVPV